MTEAVTDCTHERSLDPPAGNTALVWWLKAITQEQWRGPNTCVFTENYYCDWLISVVHELGGPADCVALNEDVLLFEWVEDSTLTEKNNNNHLQAFKSAKSVPIFMITLLRLGLRLGLGSGFGVRVRIRIWVHCKSTDCGGCLELLHWTELCQWGWLSTCV